MAAVISVLTNQFFLIFLAIALGLLIGKIKIGNFSLGVSGGIFSGILIGYLAYSWASGVQEGEVGYSSATSVLNTGVVSNLFFTFFLMLFLVSIGMKVGSSIGSIFKRYGIKFVVIGVMIPVLSMVVTLAAYHLFFKNSGIISEFETIGMYAGAMTSAPAYPAFTLPQLDEYCPFLLVRFKPACFLPFIGRRREKAESPGPNRDRGQKSRRGAKAE